MLRKEARNTLITVLSNSIYHGGICREWLCCFPWEDGGIRRRIRWQGHLRWENPRGQRIEMHRLPYEGLSDEERHKDHHG